jgi:hypothetical protein
VAVLFRLKGRAPPRRRRLLFFCSCLRKQQSILVIISNQEQLCVCVCVQLDWCAALLSSLCVEYILLGVCDRVYRAMFSTFHSCVRCMDRHMTLKLICGGLVCAGISVCFCECVCARVREVFVCVTEMSQIPAFVSRCHSTWARRSFHSPQLLSPPSPRFVTAQ